MWPLLTTAVISGFLAAGFYSFWLVVGWVAGLVLFARAILPKARQRPVITNEELWAAALIPAVPLVIRSIYLDPAFRTGDEYIVGYFSAHLNLLTFNLFGPVPNPPQWITQFPSPLFVFQKIFFLVFGVSPQSLQYSFFPFVYVAAVCLFILARNLFGTLGACWCVLGYAVFAPAVYFETMSLHPHSATATYLIFLCTLFPYLRGTRPHLALWCGFSLAACVLFHPAAYPALGLFVLAVAWKVHRRQLNVFKQAFISMIAFALVLYPFLVQSFTESSTFLFTRLAQVQALRGSWSIPPPTGVESNFSILASHFLHALRSLYREGQAAHVGYDFGDLPLLSTLALCWLAFGFIIAVRRSFARVEYGFLLIAIVSVFLSAMVLTTPAGAYHRILPIFPLLGILAYLPVQSLLSVLKLKAMHRVAVCAALLLIFAYDQHRYFTRAKDSEISHNPGITADLALIHKLEREFPHHRLVIAAFPTHGLERIYFFINPNREILVDYHNNLIRDFEPRPPYVYIIADPVNFEKTFAALDAKARIIPWNKGQYILMVRDD